MTRNEAMENNLRHLSPQALAMLGAPQLAYIREITVEGESAWGIFAANGQQVGQLEDCESAFLAARQNDLTPVYVH